LGKHIGFRRRHPQQKTIRLADIIGAVEDTLQIATVRAPSARQDRTQVLWDPVYAKVVDSRRLVTFRSLVLEQLAKGVKAQQKTSTESRCVQTCIQPQHPHQRTQLGLRAGAVCGGSGMNSCKTIGHEIDETRQLGFGMPDWFN
jgi:hypothetical protein